MALQTTIDAFGAEKCFCMIRAILVRFTMLLHPRICLKPKRFNVENCKTEANFYECSAHNGCMIPDHRCTHRVGANGKLNT